MKIAKVTRGLGKLLLVFSFAAAGSAQKTAVKQTGTTNPRPVRSYAVVCDIDPIEDNTDINSTSKSFSCSINDGGGGDGTSDSSNSQSSPNSDPNASGYAPVDCSNQSNATVANCYPQAAAGDSRTPVNGGA
jgi:hypothetical protein